MTKLGHSFKKAKLTKIEQLRFLEQLLLLLKNGFSLNESLRLLPELTLTNPVVARQINERFRQSQHFGESLREFGFAHSLATQLDMSLQQGTLIPCLEHLTKLITLRNEQAKKIKQEISYPLVIMCLMFCLLIFMRIFLADFMRDQTPLKTKIYFWVGLGFVVLVLLGLIIFVTQAIMKQKFQQLKVVVKFPWIGKIVLLYVQYLMAFNISVLVGNGFSIQKICDFCAQQDELSLQYQLGDSVQKQLEHGVSLNQIIEQEVFLSNYFHLSIEAGNSRTELHQQVSFIEQNLFNELLLKLSRLCLKIQPICFIAIGLGVLSMYWQLLVPMYRMMETMWVRHSPGLPEY